MFSGRWKMEMSLTRIYNRHVLIFPLTVSSHALYDSLVAAFAPLMIYLIVVEHLFRPTSLSCPIVPFCVVTTTLSSEIKTFPYYGIGKTQSRI